MANGPPPAPVVLADARRALAVSLVSLVWTCVASIAACAIGILGNSLVLVAFGAVGLLDAAGSTALVVHFRHSIRHQRHSERHERLALTVVTVGLLLLGIATTIESVHRIVVADRATPLVAGVVLAAVSAAALAILARAKRRIAARVGSPALHADSWVSAVGSGLALATLLGTALGAAVPWAWPDPAAATLVAVGAVLLSFKLRRDARRAVRN